MKKLLTVSAALLAAVAVSPIAMAEDDTSMSETTTETETTTTTDSSQEAGSIDVMASPTTTPMDEQAGTTPGSASGSESQSQTQSQDQSMQAKRVLGPHAVMMQTSLQNAMTELKGLRSQMELSQTPTSEQVKHFRAHSKEISEDLDTAMTHEQQLRSSMNKFPQVSQSEDFRSVSSALSDVKSTSRTWGNKSSDQAYWRDRSKVMNDLDNLEKRINNALEKTRSFSSSQLQLSSVG